MLFFKRFDFVISARPHLYIISAIVDYALRLGLHPVLRVIATVWMLTRLHGLARAMTVAIAVRAAISIIGSHSRIWMQNFLNHGRLILFERYGNRWV